MQFVQGMPIKDYQEDDQTATEIDNEDASMSQMPHLWKSDVVDTDVSRGTQSTTKLTEKGLQYRMELLRERTSWEAVKEIQYDR